MNAKNLEISPGCRAQISRRVITDEFAVCLTNDSSCRHRVDIAGYALCFHPRRSQIIAQTPDASFASLHSK